MYLVASSLLFIHMFVIMGSLKLLDTHATLIMVDLWFTVPFCTWLLFGFFTTIPEELEDAARNEGTGSRLGQRLVLRRVCYERCSIAPCGRLTGT